MFYENNAARDLKIAYVGGGSRGWAWGFMTDLANDAQLCGTLRLYDIDRDAAERNKVIADKLFSDERATSGTARYPPLWPRP